MSDKQYCEEISKTRQSLPLILVASVGQAEFK